MAEAKLYFVGALAVLLTGCGPKLDSRRVVAVDLSRLKPIVVSIDRTGVPASSAGLAPVSNLIPAVTMTGHQSSKLDAAWAAANQAQVTMMTEEQKVQMVEPLEAFKATKRVEIEKALADRRAAQADEVKTELAEFQAALQRHGDEVGWDRVTLAWKAGFPDPDPKSKRQPKPGDIFALRNWPDVVNLRTTIAAKDQEFDRIWRQRLSLGQVAREAELERLSRNMNEDLQLEASREAERLRSLAKASDVQLVPKTVAQVTAARAEPAVQQDLAGATVSMRTIVPTIMSDSTWATKVRLPIFLAHSNYRLAEPGEKGADVTGEFQKWLRQYEVGN